MKRVIALILYFSATLCVYANEDCDSIFYHAIETFNNGSYDSYKEARRQLVFYKQHCGNNYKVDDWINKCDNRINAEDQRRELNRQILEEKEAIKRKEERTLERAARRESNRLVYLTVYCDVPGRFSIMENQLKSNLRWTNNRDEAYWFVSVTVRNFELSRRNDFYSYHIAATIEVQNAVDWNFETKSGFVHEEDGCYVNNEDEAERIVADMLYEHEDHHLYKDIETKIRALIELNDDIVPDKQEIDRNTMAIYVDYSNPSIQRTSITETLQVSLRNFFKENGYIVKNNDKKINDLIRNYLLEEQGSVPPKEITPISGKGVDKLCYVRVVDDNDNLSFFCQFIDLKKNIVLESGRYPFIDEKVKGNIKVSKSPNKETIEVVAEVLAYQLGLFPDGQIKELHDRLKDSLGLGLGDIGAEDKSLEEIVKKPKIYNSNNTVAFFESLIMPGLGQWLKGHEVLGVVTFLGEATLVYGAVHYHQLAQTLYNGFTPNTPVNIEDVNKYNSYAKLSKGFIIGAAGMYVINLTLAVLLNPKNSNQAFVAPLLIPIDNTLAMGMGLMLNF